MAIATTPRGYIERPRPSGLADVIDVILDKGLVIDAYVRVALIGIEILTIDARIVIASVDTYLRFAEAVNRMDIAHDDTSQGLPELMQNLTSDGAESKTKGALGASSSRSSATVTTTRATTTATSAPSRGAARRRGAARPRRARSRPPDRARARVVGSRARDERGLRLRRHARRRRIASGVRRAGGEGANHRARRPGGTHQRAEGRHA